MRGDLLTPTKEPKLLSFKNVADLEDVLVMTKTVSHAVKRKLAFLSSFTIFQHVKIAACCSNFF